MVSCASLPILQPLPWESNQPSAQGGKLWEASLSPCPSPLPSVQSSGPQHPGGQPVPGLVLERGKKGREGRRDPGDWSAERRQRFYNNFTPQKSPVVQQVQQCGENIWGKARRNSLLFKDPMGKDPTACLASKDLANSKTQTFSLSTHSRKMTKPSCTSVIPSAKSEKLF